MEKKPLKQRILESSLELFQKNGYHGVTVEQIVEKANTSKGGFYHYFKSKDELLYEIHDVFISYVIKKAQETYDEYETPVLRLCGMLHSFIKVFDVYNPYITVFYQESAYLQAAYKEVINEKRDQYRKLIERVIKEGQERGDFRREVPANIATMSIIGMINWSYKWYKRDGPLSIEQIGDVFRDLILHSIATEEGLTEANEQNQLLGKKEIVSEK